MRRCYIIYSAHGVHALERSEAALGSEDGQARSTRPACIRVATHGLLLSLLAEDGKVIWWRLRVFKRHLFEPFPKARTTRDFSRCCRKIFYFCGQSEPSNRRSGATDRERGTLIFEAEAIDPTRRGKGVVAKVEAFTPRRASQPRPHRFLRLRHPIYASLRLHNNAIMHGLLFYFLFINKYSVVSFGQNAAPLFLDHHCA